MAVLSATDKLLVTAAVRRFTPAPPVVEPVPRRPHARGDGRLKRVDAEPVRRCVFCGGATTGVACYGHTDLLALDPYYGGLA